MMQKAMVNVLLVVLLVLAALSTHAQIAIRVVIRKPAPAELSAWQRDPSVAQITVTNMGSTVKRVRMSVSITDEGGRVVASTDDNAAGIPRFTIPGGGAMTRLSGRDVLNTGAVRINKSLYRTAAQTNSLPEGDYTCCVRLLNDDGSDVDGSAEACADVLIVIADPPRLILPAFDQVIESDRVQFQWTPVMAGATTGIGYELVVVPLGATDDPAVAIERSEKLLVKTVARTDYLMTAMDRGLTVNGATRFAWRVRAVTSDGRPAGSNNGLSEVGVFSINRAGTDTRNPVRRLPDTIVMAEYKIVVSSWDPRNPDGTFSGKGCLQLQCDNRSNKPIEIPDVEKSKVQRKGYDLRTMTIVDEVKNPSAELSRKDVIATLGKQYQASTRITVPVRSDLLKSDVATTSSAIMGALRDMQRDCHQVDFSGVVLLDSTATTSIVLRGAATYPSNPLVDIPMRWYPTDSFVVDIDTLYLNPTEMKVGGRAFHISALLGYGTGEPGVFPFTIRDAVVTAPCELYGTVRSTPTDPMFVGESQCVITAEDYVVDFSRARSLRSYPNTRFGIDIGNVQTVPQASAWSNQGFLRLNMAGSAVILDSGITMQLTTRSNNPSRNLQFTTIPVKHLFAYDSVRVGFRNSQFVGGDFRGTVYPDSLHITTVSAAAGVVVNRNRQPIDPDYTIRFQDVIDTTMPEFRFGTPWHLTARPFAFIINRGSRAKVYGRYPGTWILPPRWSPFTMPATADLVSTGGFAGLLFDDGCRVSTVINGRDVYRQPFNGAYHVAGRVLLGASGVEADLTYTSVFDSVTVNGLEFGRVSSARYRADSLRFGLLGTGPDPSDPAAPKLSGFRISFSGSAVDSTDISGIGFVHRSSTRFMIDNVVLTSMADVPAPFINISEEQRTRNPWKLSIEPATPTQTSMGYAIAATGVLQLTGSVIREPVHFSQPFRIIALELLANGGSGRLALDFNSAGQTFDGFPYVPEYVMLSPLPTDSASQPYLSTAGIVSLPFFGASYQHVFDYADSNDASPYLKRRIVHRTTPFMGYPGSTVALRKQDALGQFAFDIAYNSAAQHGFIGTGTVNLLGIGQLAASVIINPDQLCFQGKAEAAQSSEMLAGLSTFGGLADVWACGCADNDAMSAIAVGGRVAVNASGMFGLARAGGGLEATLGLRPDVATFWISGGTMLNLAAFDNDQHMLVMGVVNKRERFARATVHLQSTWATPIISTQSDFELDFYRGEGASGEQIAYFQGKGSLEAQFSILINSESNRQEAGFFVGTNVPKEDAWILYATDGRFRLQEDLIPRRLTGFYAYRAERNSIDLLLVSGRLDTYIALGGFTQGLGISAAVDIHGRILGGLAYGSAFGNLQLVLGAESGFYGRVALQGCINTVVWDSYCASVDLGVGMTTTRGLFIE